MSEYEKLPPDFKAKWIAALRSGEYEQTQGTLHKSNAFCCLGVACMAVGYDDPSEVESIGFISVAADKIPQMLHGDCGVPEVLSVMNDDDGKSFAEIADWIEANL